MVEVGSSVASILSVGDRGVYDLSANPDTSGSYTILIAVSIFRTLSRFLSRCVESYSRRHGFYFECYR